MPIHRITPSTMCRVLTTVSRNTSYSPSESNKDEAVYNGIGLQENLGTLTILFRIFFMVVKMQNV